MYYWDVEKVFLEFKNKVIGKIGSLEVKMDKSGPSIVDIWRKSLYVIQVVKLGSLVSHTEWSNISERNSKINLIENLKKGPELML